MTAGEINAKLVQSGESIDIEDVVIAAIALEFGEPVLTGNPAPFERVPGLRIETY